MKRRTFKQQIKYGEEQLFEENKDFYNKITSEYYMEKPKKIKRILSISIPSSMAAIATLILCLVFLLPSTESPARKYLQENERYIEMELLQVNEKLNGIILDTDISYECKAWHFYDMQYNDTLYYMVILTSQDTFEKMQLYLYVNESYENKKSIHDNSTQIPLNGLTVSYNEDITLDDIFYTFTYTAQTEFNGIGIYVEYEQMTFEEESNFFNLFQQTIKKI